MEVLPCFRSLPLCILFFIVTFHFASLQVQEPASSIGGNNDDDLSDQAPSQLAQVEYSTPNIQGQYFYEHFDDPDLFSSKWIMSSASKTDSKELKYDGEWTRIETQTPLKGR